MLVRYITFLHNLLARDQININRKATTMMKGFEPLPADTERLAKVVVDSAYKVHSSLGPGLLESFYQTCLTHELRTRGVPRQSQVAFPIVYGGVHLEAGLRIDLLVDKRLIVELK